MGQASSIIESPWFTQTATRIGQAALSLFITNLEKIASTVVTYYTAEPTNDINRSGNVDGENLKTLIEQARKQNGIESRLYFNFAFAGHVNTGKSSLINAIRGYTDKEPEAAVVGETETTQKPTYYKFPHGFRVRLYDIPGSGVVRHRAENYFL
uniref:IRG-type G domain-containing protein n=1 Tax=Acrobeloides nanus TaxID=290746 RepID=A0A914D912_9BILA